MAHDRITPTHVAVTQVVDINGGIPATIIAAETNVYLGTTSQNLVLVNLQKTFQHV
jgi:hypothetical protein